jgi:hypothetical protein
VERRKATEAMMELEKQQKSLEAESATAKPKNKQAVNGSKKKAL